MRRLAEHAAARVEALVNEDRIGLAVTGLSGAGKTVFITSLVNNLLALGRPRAQGRDTLPKFTAALRGADGATRLRGVRVLPPEPGAPPPFDYAGKLAALAAEAPAWPAPTTALARLSLAIELERAPGLARLAGRRRIRLDILDYPGEWLIDLPLLQQDFAAWSAETLALLCAAPRATLAARFLAWLALLDPAAKPDATTLAHGCALYAEALRRCAERGLRTLQPGRFLQQAADFFPLAGRGATADWLRRRYAAYVARIRAEFFDTHFRRFDRQVLLVDLLGALHAGRSAFEDTARAVAGIATGLGRGWGGGLRAERLPFAHRIPPLLLGGRVVPRPIGHIAFAATKADHVPALRRDNLRNLLRALAEPAIAAGPATSFHSVAAVLATEDAVISRDGRPVEIVRGVVLGESQARGFDVGEVPSALPPPDFWSHDGFFRLPVFRPPRIDPAGTAGIAHLGLDELLLALIGGRL